MCYTHSSIFTFFEYYNNFFLLLKSIFHSNKIKGGTKNKIITILLEELTILVRFKIDDEVTINLV